MELGIGLEETVVGIVGLEELEENSLDAAVVGERKLEVEDDDFDVAVLDERGPEEVELDVAVFVEEELDS
jgi:hypothetical protein